MHLLEVVVEAELRRQEVAVTARLVDEPLAEAQELGDARLVPMYGCMYVCMYVCTCMHTCAGTRGRASRTRRRARQCMYMCMHICMYMCMRICMYMCMRMCIYMCMRMCVYMCMHMCMYMCMNIGVCTCVCICVCIRGAELVDEPKPSDWASVHQRIRRAFDDHLSGEMREATERKRAGGAVAGNERLLLRRNGCVHVYLCTCIPMHVYVHDCSCGEEWLRSGQQ